MTREVIIIFALVVVLVVLEIWPYVASVSKKESYLYCTNGSCYSLFNNNYEGAEKECTVYAPPDSPLPTQTGSPVQPFAAWRPSACAGVYTTVMDDFDNRRVVCSCCE